MGAGYEQRPWTPTVRRGPIAAEIQTPAPNHVDLPPLLGSFLFEFRIFQIKFMAK